MKVIRTWKVLFLKKKKLNRTATHFDTKLIIQNIKLYMKVYKVRFY